MAALPQRRVIHLAEERRVADKSKRGVKTTLAGGPREFPVASKPREWPLRMSDEKLDYYGWVFCQSGFQHLNMTFEQFLAVASMLSSTDNGSVGNAAF